MLMIKNKQMEVFKQHAKDIFKKNVFNHLRSVFPEETLLVSDEKLEYLINIGIINSQKYEISMEWDIRRYLECCILYGWNFDTDPNYQWAINILNDKDFDGKTKMDKIEQIDIN